MSTTADKIKVFPRQSQIYNNPYASTKARAVRKLKYGIKTPETAWGDYIDKKCPFTGDVNIVPVFFRGEIIKMKNEKTIVVRKNYLHYHKKYKRYERRNTKFNVHLSPCFFGLVQVGDTAICAATRPLSKTKHHVVVDFVKSIKNENEFKILI